ncbi:hypothetical protein DRQ20_04380 [bacterium]|nr:MAG: hypothetical protein DRQ20_04380 [bacterium]
MGNPIYSGGGFLETCFYPREKFGIYLSVSTQLKFKAYSRIGGGIRYYFGNRPKIETSIVRETPPKMPPVLSAVAFFERPDGERTRSIEEGEKVNLVIKIKNTGKYPAKNLEVKLTPIKNCENLRFQKSVVVSSISPGQEITVKIPVCAGKSLKEGEAKFKVEVLEPYFGADAEPVEVAIRLSSKTRKIVLQKKNIEEGEVAPGKLATVKFTLLNKGNLLKNVEILLSAPEGITLFDDYGNPSKNLRFSVETFGANTTSSFSFQMFVSKRYPQKTVILNGKVIQKDSVLNTFTLTFQF